MKIFKSDGKEPKGVIEFFTPATTGRPNVEIGSSTMEPHTESEFSAHKGDEYSYVVTGELICYTEEGEEYQLKAGDAIFTPAGQRHRSKCISDERCTCIWIEVAL